MNRITAAAPRAGGGGGFVAAINVLVVGDGPYQANVPPHLGINFAPSQDETDDTFTVSELVYLLTQGSDVAISVDTAHRRADAHATFQNFVFTAASIAKYDVLWLLGYEGWNGIDPPPGGAISAAEVAAITAFMDQGGGVFATGDHAGMGSFISGGIPRVRTMRKWFVRTQDLPAGYPSTAINYAGSSVTSLNWGGATNFPNMGVGRADTLVMNPSDTPSQYAFDDQSDNLPQQLAFPSNIVHPILEGSTGGLSRFPDHMHEGEVVTPSNLGATMTVNGQNYAEYPAAGGFQPAPAVVATGTITGGHSTIVNASSSCETFNFTTDDSATTAATIGILCAYDGRGANVGRIVTDSSFHHCLDLNLVGDPCGSTPDRRAGFGPAMSAPASGSVLADMQAFYVNTAIWLARPAVNFYFAVDKGSFGYDEASANETFPLFSNSFWLVVDGYSKSQVQAAINANALTLGGAFSAISGISITRGSLVATQAQRVMIPYSVQFSGAAMSAFPTGNANPVQMLLQAGITVAGKAYTAETTIELVAGADPYFENINPQTDNVFWLSQDLCVFTINPVTKPSVPGIPVTFSTSDPNGQDPTAASAFIEGVLNYMNGSAQFTDAGNNNPFASFPSATSSGDSSVTPTTDGHTNYNFAIARVRLRGPAGTKADPVKVFFRLFLTQSNDTDYQPATSYKSMLDASGWPDQPLAAPDGSTTPFFASGSAAGDYGAGGINVKPITVDASGDTSVYFGCFLDVYSGAYNWKARGTHHCLVAQIAYDDAPIINANGITVGPANSDKLAQRNLQITPSGNPGGPAAHRIPQTFDLRPSPPISDTGGELLDYPDELMIDWGNTPAGSTATIYWPQAQALEVVRMARRLYGTDELSVADPSTVQCTVKGGVTCVPIPIGSTERLAGLFTVDLPTGVRAGQQFDIVVRRLSTRRVVDIEVARASARVAAEVNAAATQRNWRYVVGTFQVTIPVALEESLLPAEENTYAIMLWRLSQLAPGDRWYRVLQRYLTYVAGRIVGFGGDPTTILPSPTGIPLPAGSGGGGGVHHHTHGAEEFTGKVEGLLYDRFGDFEGFLLRTEHGHEHRFHATERAIEERVREAWEDRIVISVRVHRHHPSIPVSIVLRRLPH